MPVTKPPQGAKVYQVTDYLRALIEAGEWKPGTRGPRLDDLNADFFGEGVGPKKARDAYAPLIEAGIVEARPGSTGGHILVQQATEDRPLDLSAGFTEIWNAVNALATKNLYCVELEDIRTPSSTGKGATVFGQSLHRSRLAAEDFAVEYLVRLGETEKGAREAATLATYAAADSSSNYGVRIYGVSLTGEIKTSTSRRSLGRE